MRLAIISDTHLGDPNSTMAFLDTTTGKPYVGLKFGEFIDTVKAENGEEPLDYLILLGDILDFSIASYTRAYEIGKFFFQQLRNAGVAKEIIYVPGNHDFDLWETVEYQVNVTRPIEKGDPPAHFRMSVPAILDDRTTAKPLPGRFVLHNVNKSEGDGPPHYGGLFLDKMTNPETRFNFAYPNVYILTDAGTVLLTHGQYLEPYWSMMGKWAQVVMHGELDLKDVTLADLQETVALNFPLSQLGCSSIGQAGPLTRIVERLEKEIEQKDLVRVSLYLDRLGLELKKRCKGVLRWTFPLIFHLVKRQLLQRLSEVDDARYSDRFVKDLRIQQMLEDFYASTVREVCELRERYGTEFALPDTMIFGHTHQPIAWRDANAPTIRLKALGDKNLSMFNTGGWLCAGVPDGELKFCGAEVFFYSSDKSFSSKRIS